MEERLADLQVAQAFPSTNRLQAALRKEGIKASLADIKNTTPKAASRQVLQPPQQYKGKVTAVRIDDRWATGLLHFESKPATSDNIDRFVMLVHDSFSRYVLGTSPYTRKYG